MIEERILSALSLWMIKVIYLDRTVDASMPPRFLFRPSIRMTSDYAGIKLTKERSIKLRGRYWHV